MQFTILLHYPPLPSPSSGVKPTSFTATIRGTLVSILSTQLRYVVREPVELTPSLVSIPKKINSKSSVHPMRLLMHPMINMEENQNPHMPLSRILQQVERPRLSVQRKSAPLQVVCYETTRTTLYFRWPSQRGNYVSLFKDVASVIRQGTIPAVKWQESADALEIIELAYQSSKEGKTIEVPPRH